MTSKPICNKMKKIILFTFLTFLISAVPSYAALGNALQARTNNLVQREALVASREAKITQVQTNITQNLQQRAQAEISRRLEFLNQLITKINGIKKLSDTEKSILQTQIQAQVDSLNGLQAKITADTDNAILKADVKSIVSNYYIFLFFRVQVNLFIATDRISTTIDNFNQVYTKLQARVSEAQTAGDDVTKLNVSLADMKAKITDASSQANAAQTEISPLTAGGYPSNKATFLDAKAKIATSVADLKIAYQDAVFLRNGLMALGIKNPEASNSAH